VGGDGTQPGPAESNTQPADHSEPTAESAEEPDLDPHPQPSSAGQNSGTVADVRPWHLAVLGHIRLAHHQADGDTHAELSASLAPKHREVLTYLALHPDGVRREVLAGAIWPDASRDRPYNSFHATLSQLRRALRTAAHDDQVDLTVHSDGRYALDHGQVDVDLWQLRDALAEARRSTGEQGGTAVINQVLALYRGDLGADVTTEWLEAPREALRRDVLDIVSARAHAVRKNDPAQALVLLEHARHLDPYNEALYRAIGRVQARLGQWEAIPRTHDLLTTTLAEIGEQLSPETEAFFDVLGRPQPGESPENHRAAG
jgi:DNA-binding SARP family transcriptional activator